MTFLKHFPRHSCPIVALTIVVFVLTFLPILDIFLILGSAWAGVPPTFTDESFYMARVQTVVEGHGFGSHPYFYEHRDDPPLVVFGGAWINAIPQMLGLSMNVSLMVNFVFWSLVCALVLYWLFRELRIGPWMSVLATLFVYIQSYSHIWRPANLQPVYPFIFLFYIALLRLIREQNRKNVYLLAFATGTTFYLYAFMWQTAVITLGLLVLYALVSRHWSLLKAALLSGVLGGIMGAPVPLYMLWLSNTSPYFWESLARLGLTNTHLPMAEVIYSGGWIGIALGLPAILLWRMSVLRKDAGFVFLTTFLAISGFGLWIMQGSNLITGKLFETGEHVRLLIQPWIIFAFFSLGIWLWDRRSQLTRTMQIFSILIIASLTGASVHFTAQRFPPFLPQHVDAPAWRLEQLYAKPFAWLQTNEKDPVVVWIEPRDYLSMMLPVFTRHFTLYTYFGMLELVPEGEIRERYLVSQYFNNPTRDSLQADEEMNLYLGRRDFPHYAKTLERGIKICKIFFFWNKEKDCGTPPTPQELMGPQFFVDLENKFKNDIKPNIKDYLAKYHVSYLLKDKVLDPNYKPQMLGAVLVYSDDRYELWKF